VELDKDVALLVSSLGRTAGLIRVINLRLVTIMLADWRRATVLRRIPT
jgi:hypothetical protein